MRPKLTKQTVNERISDRGLELVDDYIDTRTKSKFKCEHGHSWMTTPNRIMKGGGCPECTLRDSKLTKEIVNDRIKHRGLIMVGDYITNKTKSQFECQCGHFWMAAPNNIVDKESGCPVCADKSLTKEIVNERIAHRGLTMVGDYVTNRIKSQFKCHHDHYWLATPSDVDKGGTGCPTCAVYGYDPSKPGTVYVLDFSTFIKYGITNDLPRRLNEHKKNGKFITSLTKLFENGIHAQMIERQIKQILGGNFVTKEICPDGYTETLCPSKLKDLNVMINK